MANQSRSISGEGYPDLVFACHYGEEIGPRMLERIAKHMGLELGDL